MGFQKSQVLSLSLKGAGSLLTLHESDIKLLFNETTLIVVCKVTNKYSISDIYALYKYNYYFREFTPPGFYGNISF